MSAYLEVCGMLFHVLVGALAGGGSLLFFYLRAVGLPR